MITANKCARHDCIREKALHFARVGTVFYVVILEHKIHPTNLKGYFTRPGPRKCAKSPLCVS